MAKSHPEDRKYMCRLHPCNEISKCLCEIFEISKKQDLTPRVTPRVLFQKGEYDGYI